MIKRGLGILCLVLAMLGFAPRTYAQKGKSEIAVGYGYFTFYSFMNKGYYGAPMSNSSGASVVSYRYYLTRDLTIGLGLGYENISNWGTFVSIVPEFTAAYMDTRNSLIRIKLYGAASLGINNYADARNGYGHKDQSGLKLWAFQATPIGLRWGRQFAWFAELGFGYKGIVHGGVELRFPRHLQHKAKPE